MEVAENIYRLTQGVTNFYLIGESGKFTLVDAGTPGDWDFFRRSLASLGRLPDLEAVLLTHAHPDHTGFAEQARTDAGAAVWIHEADAEAARTGRAGKHDGHLLPYLAKAQTYRTTISLARRGATKMIPIKEVSSFADGEVIDVPGHPRQAWRRVTHRAAPFCCWSSAVSCSPATSSRRRTRSPDVPARRSCPQA